MKHAMESRLLAWSGLLGASNSVLGSFLVRFAGLALSFVVLTLLARFLGPTEYGVYSFAYSLLILLALPAQGGLSTLLLRETAKARALNSYALQSDLWRWSMIVSVCVYALIIIIVAIIGSTLQRKIDGPIVQVLFIGLLFLPAAILISLRSGVLIGLHRVVLGQLSENILRPGFLAGLLFIVFLSGLADTSKAATAMALTAIAAYLSFVVVEAVYQCVAPSYSPHKAKTSHSRQWLRSLTPLVLVAGLSMVNRHTDILIIGLIRSPEEVGIYRVASQTALLVAFALNVVNIVFSPTFAALHAQRRRAELQKAVRSCARLAFLGALLPSILLVLASSMVLEAVFGRSYLPGSDALAILAIGQLINVTIGPVAILLNMTGHERSTAIGVALGAVVNLVLNLALVPLYGMTGAAIASLVAVMSWNGILLMIVTKRLGIYPLPYNFGQSRDG